MATSAITTTTAVNTTVAATTTALRATTVAPTTTTLAPATTPAATTTSTSTTVAPTPRDVITLIVNQPTGDDPKALGEVIVRTRSGAAVAARVERGDCTLVGRTITANVLPIPYAGYTCRVRAVASVANGWDKAVDQGADVTWQPKIFRGAWIGVPDTTITADSFDILLRVDHPSGIDLVSSDNCVFGTPSYVYETSMVTIYVINHGGFCEISSRVQPAGDEGFTRADVLRVAV